VDTKPANPALVYKIIENRKNSDPLEHRVEELASIAAFTGEVTPKLSMTQMIASTPKRIHSIKSCIRKSTIFYNQ